MNNLFFYKIIIALCCLSMLSCSKKFAALQNGTYYNINPDNFISKWQVSSDSIFILTLNPQFQTRGAGSEDSSILKIHNTVKKGNTYNLCVEELVDKPRKLKFRVLAIVKNKEGTFMEFYNNSAYATLKECRQQKFKNPEHDFCISIYTQRSLDSFRHFKMVKDLDTATACTFIKHLRALAETNRKKIESVAKHDMYLSGSMKELMNRTLISMQINPVDYTMDESNAMFIKCDKLLQD